MRVYGLGFRVLKIRFQGLEVKRFGYRVTVEGSAFRIRIHG